MSYVPNTPEERLGMLAAMGRSTVDELFAGIPDGLKVKGLLNLPEPKTEIEVMSEMTRMAGGNKIFRTCFRGAGAYRHFIPSVVRHLASREEFVTAYTPYQAEMSQGVLQTIFEYQTTVCELTGMDVSNAGVYDGAHAAAESAAMFRDRKRNKTIVLGAVKPQTLSVIRTYCASAGEPIQAIPCGADGLADIEALKASLDAGTASVYVEQPNYYGLMEDVEAIAGAVHAAGAKLTVGVYPTSLAVLRTPAEYDADAAVGEAQPLGMPLSFGGPYLGFMAVRKEDMRRLPGRIVGRTADADGRAAYVLTLQAREQHIRREKASSSICSNEALCALTATIYCAAMGRQGLADAANQCMSKARYAEKAITESGFVKVFDGFYFNEFVTECPCDAAKLERFLAGNGILGGLPADIGGKTRLLWCVTELNTVEEIDTLASLLKEAAKWN